MIQAANQEHHHKAYAVYESGAQLDSGPGAKDQQHQAGNSKQCTDAVRDRISNFFQDGAFRRFIGLFFLPGSSFHCSSPFLHLQNPRCMSCSGGYSSFSDFYSSSLSASSASFRSRRFIVGKCRQSDKPIFLLTLFGICLSSIPNVFDTPIYLTFSLHECWKKCSISNIDHRTPRFFSSSINFSSLSVAIRSFANR